MNNTHGDNLHSPNTTANGPTINELIYRTKPEETTGGLSSNQSLNNYYQPRGEVGWICPVCGRGLAPSTAYCPCNSNNITFLNGGCTFDKIYGSAIDCNTTPPKAYYTTTSATSATKKS